MSESPNTVHGRLLEAVHISGYSFERACSELEWLLDEDRWKQCGYDDIAAFQATIDWSEFKIAAEKRKSIAQKLADIGASQRATARMLGVNHTTIGRDLENGANAPQQPDEIIMDGMIPPDDGAFAPTEWFQAAVDPAESAKREAAKRQKAQDRERRNQELSAQPPALPEGKFAAIYADPPWQFKVWSGAGKDRAAENHYPTMALQEICALPVKDMAADDCALFMWAVMPQLPEALEVMRAWGFEYKTCAFTWVKTTKDEQRWATGMGYWTRANAELCLLGTRGSPSRLNADVQQVISAPRGKHSSKPMEAYERIERLVPGPYIELFSRVDRTGWKPWGFESPNNKASA